MAASRLPRAIQIFSLTLVLTSACRPVLQDEPQVARIQRELGLTPPIRCTSFSHIDDGGTGFAQFIDGRAKKLLVVLDNRSAAFKLDSDGRANFPPRYIHLHQYPTDPGSLRLDFGSPAESAVVDLFRLAIQRLVTPEQESLLVWEQKWAVFEIPNSPNSSVNWLERRSASERLALDLRAGILEIESRRRGGPAGRRHATSSGATPVAPAAPPP